MDTAAQRTLRSGPVELTWEPAARLGVLAFVEAGQGGGAEADELTTELERWLGAAPGPFRFLVDCSEMVDVDAGWRTRWAEFFKQHRDESVIAWFNANPRVQLIITMFRKGTGVLGAAFETEAEARDYLARTDPPA